MSTKTRFPLKIKAAIIIIALSAVLCVVAILMSAIRFSRTNEENFKNQASDLAYVAALTVDGDAMKVVRDAVFEVFDKIPDDDVVLSDDWGSDAFNAQIEKFAFITDMPEFKKVYEQLSKTQTAGISTLASIYATDYDFSHSIPYALYLVDAAEEDPCLPGVADHADEADWESAEKHEPMKPYITNYDAYGWLVTATAGVYDSSGEYVGVICVDLDMNAIKANESSFIISLTATLVAITIVICIITLIIIDLAVIKPLNKLSDIAVGYISNNEDRKKFSDFKMRRRDEIGNLSGAMIKMENDIGNYIDNLTSVTAEKERISAELGVAAKIQADMLPTDFPDRKDIELYAAMTPAKEVGGDFYDFFFIDDDHIALVMADVSGKGVPAAMFMIIAKTLIKIRTTAPGTPAQMLWDINNTLCADNPSGLFVTAWLGILTLSTGELISSNAGHEYPALMHEGGDYELIESENMPPLAAAENIEYYDEKVVLKPGDRIFLYTDGVPEGKNPDGERFGTDKMLKILNHRHNVSPKELLDDMMRKVNEFAGESDQFDDVTIMSVIWKGGK